MKGRIVILGLLLFMGLPVVEPGAAAATDSKKVSEVWALEDEYWRCVKAGDVERYVKLWHDSFIGWPCGKDHPARKSGVGDWVREVRDKKIKVEVSLTREGAEDFGTEVVVHYRFTRVDTYPDGHVEGRGDQSKITHTWMRVGNRWLIIGGMCGSLADSAK